ncbi:(4Fe-4S)-binding protein [candidate division KSB1 bacterium]|nr:MAG: (4Fe-4S)-binding protein [candidate division KSB1 bacterium]
MIISIASGKGGTGKTTVAVNFALALEGKIQLLDCDVEEPNVDIFLKPTIERQEPLYIPKPVVDESKCTYCGKCSEVCLYNAIAVVKEKVLIFYELCHSCGACKVVCPKEAIFEEDVKKGVIEEGRAGAIEFVKGELEVSEASPTPLVRAVKKKVKANYISIIDASPGTSCPVVEAVKDSDFCILVTEPTPFGLNDLKLAVEMCKKLKIPTGVIINRADVGDKEVDKYLKQENIPILMRIPMDREIAEKYSEGKTFVESKPEYKKEFQNLLKRIEVMI